MSRTKEYRIVGRRAASDGAAPETATNVGSARIEMMAVAGTESRFGSAVRTVDFSAWIGRGIDAWVLAAVHCLKAMLQSGSHETASVVTYSGYLRHFFSFLEGRETLGETGPSLPADLSVVHVQAFVGWIQKVAQARGWREGSARHLFTSVKTVLREMIAQGFIQGDAAKLFPRSALPWQRAESRQTALSDAEQERLATAIKTDLVALHHGRLILNQSGLQSLRLLLVAHRQGANLTPLLEMRRTAPEPGFLPGTLRVQTVKYRSRKTRTGAGRSTSNSDDLVFSLSEGAVLQQAISSSQDLVDDAPSRLKDRIWLYRSVGISTRGDVLCVSKTTLTETIRRLVLRHDLRGDEGGPLKLNLSRLRKSYFDRALRVADGDLLITANLMGNTPRVASLNYPTMNEARRKEAAEFMNVDYVALMRVPSTPKKPPTLRLSEARRSVGLPSSTTETPVSSCLDTLRGEHAPHDGRSHCDRYVMCLFCSSFAVVGTPEELWRLFSFQVFAKAELGYLDEALGPERTSDEVLEDLRDRYRLAVPYIDDFTERQCAPGRVARAREMVASSMHPYWQHQMDASRRSRTRTTP